MIPWGLLCEKIGVMDQKPWARIEMTARLIVAIHNSIEIPQISLCILFSPRKYSLRLTVIVSYRKWKNAMFPGLFGRIETG